MTRIVIIVKSKPEQETLKGPTCIEVAVTEDELNAFQRHELAQALTAMAKSMAARLPKESIR